MHKELFLGKWLNLSEQSVVLELLKEAQTIHVKRNSLLVEAGEIQQQVLVLVRGVARGFLLDADGRDITDCFAYRQGEVLMGCNALGTPSLISLETMRDCELLSIPLSRVLPLMDENPVLLKCYIQFLLKGLDRHWEGKMLMYRCSAMERYQWFLKKYPGLIDQVSNKHVASFLGMTPVTLSRLRRSVRENAQKAETYGTKDLPGTQAENKHSNHEGDTK